jgi:hypothetical protein
MWNAPSADGGCTVSHEETEGVSLEEVSVLKGFSREELAKATNKGESRIRRILLLDEFLAYTRNNKSSFQIVRHARGTETLCKVYPFNVSALNIGKDLIDYVLSETVYKEFLKERRLQKVPKLRLLLSIPQSTWKYHRSKIRLQENI